MVRTSARFRKAEVFVENVLPTVFETDRCAPQKDPRLHDRRPVCLRVAVADKSGMAEGEVLDLSLRGCGLCLKKRLVRGQYLWLKIYHVQGKSTPVCDLVRVKWVEDDRVGLEFLYIAPENFQRLHRIFGDQIMFALED
jgi:PilZ domain